MFDSSLPLQLLKKAAGVLGGDCLLCGARSPGALACPACTAALPVLRAACPTCALPMPRDEKCGRCLRRAPALDSARAALEYRFPVDRVMRRFKFAGDLAAGEWLAGRLAVAVAAAPVPELVVVPPIDATRLRTRGFNQALEVARVVAAARRVRLDRDAVIRVRVVAPQSTLGSRERRANLRGVFACRRELGGRHVAIVDDVMTTGATVEAVALALRQAGARRVDAWVVARTPEPGD